MPARTGGHTGAAAPSGDAPRDGSEIQNIKAEAQKTVRPTSMLHTRRRYQERD
jgi:hypothetical protein